MNEFGLSVQQTSEGGYIVAGFGHGAYLVKTNPSGDTLWTRLYGEGTMGYSVQQTSDGNYIMGGYSGSGDVWLIKLDANGGTLWSKTYGGASNNVGQSVQQTSDGGYIVAGWNNGNGTQVYLIKTDSLGDSLWSRTYGGWGSIRDDEGYSVQQTRDGGYIVAGMSVDRGGLVLIKTDASGDTLWTRAYGGGTNGLGNQVQQTRDGGYIIGSALYVAGHSSLDACLIKTDSLGDTLWTRTFGGTNTDAAYSVQQTSDGGYIATGVTGLFGGQDVYLIKTDSLGDTLWTRTFGGPGDDEGQSVQQTQDGGYIIAGETNSFGAGGYDVYLIKTDANGNVGVEESSPHVPITFLTPVLSVRPNPFVSFTRVPGHEEKQFVLYDISGRRVGAYWGAKIGTDVPPGVYFVVPEDRNTKPIRIVKIR